MYPSHLRYSKDHEWISVQGDSGKVGITDFAQHELGDIVFVELPDLGRTFRAGEVLGTIDSVKASSEIYAPIACEVIETNAALADAPQTLNQDPHGAGWLCRVRVLEPKEVEALMDAAAYEAHVAK